eukprot:2733930-Alexandrium_andersonii.AAC.1
MSASLVGSEMCIRDRSCHYKESGRQPAPPEECARLGSLLGGAAPCGCLLYTSDAADDMQW